MYDLVVISCQSWVIFFHYQINGLKISGDFEQLVPLVIYVSDIMNVLESLFIFTHNMF